MKSIIKFFFVALVATAFVACNGSHFINDKAEREAVKADFENRKAKINAEELYSVFNEKLTQKEREALTFLYAYMPLGDIACYDGEFFLRNVQTSLKTREEMPWGKTIPDREFRHFVLPVRVNNENLDSARWIFYEELKPRIQHLSLYDAVLEVNHWCHEYVTYTPSDARTSSPLASIKTAYARCGEESTFLVAALRSVGIPARQVYTPRWAHTDDNHAWVEAWVDGEWMFLGACEPEPVLNLGWFNAPASRGMLMHTKVFGKYNGPEEVMQRTPLFTEINVIDNYAPCSRAEVVVTDEDGNTIEGANVEFKLYNYAEFYTVARKTTDANGRTFLTAGNGDMIVWATHNGNFAFTKLTFGTDSVVRLQITESAKDSQLSTLNSQLDIIPPREWANLPTVTDEQRAENNRRFAYEDSIRNAYIATMFDETKARAYIESIPILNKFSGYNDEFNEIYEDHLVLEYEIMDLLINSRGNHSTILKFLDLQNEQYQHDKIEWRDKIDFRNKISDKVDFLNYLSKKDLRDITTEIINDHFNEESVENYHYYITEEYIRNPRVANEMLTPYRSFFRNQISQEDKEAYQNDPMQLVDWVRKNIKIDPQCNLGGAPIQPMGVWHARTADALSRDIFFVALARSLDIPARIDEVTAKVQLVNNNYTFTDINFESAEQTTTPQGKLVATFQPTKTQSDPKYYYHFTISKITDKGHLQLLNYDEGESGMEQGAAWSNLLKNGTTLDCGNYLMVTGSRLANGGVLAQMNFFTIEENQTTQTELVMRQSTDQVQVIGSFNSESLYNKYEAQDNSQCSVLSTTGRGYFVIGIIGYGDEPTNHALRDIANVANELNDWGRPMILLSPNSDLANKTFSSDLIATLNSQLTNLNLGIDINGAIQNQIIQEMKLANATLPIFIIADTFNRVVFCSQGYTIGLGEQLVKTAKQL